jgi:hypothetical protein
MIAIGGTGRRIDEALDAGIACRHQHVEETVDVGALVAMGSSSERGTLPSAA